MVGGRADNGEATHTRTTPAADVGVRQFNFHPRADFHCATAALTGLGPGGKARLQAGLGNFQQRGGHGRIGAERHQTARYTHGLAQNFGPAHLRSGNAAEDSPDEQASVAEGFPVWFRPA